MRITAKMLENLRDIVNIEPPMTKVSLDGLHDAKEIRKRLEVELNKHIRAKESIQALVDRIRKVSGANESRAKAIARTEKTRMVNGTRIGAAIDEYLKEYETARKLHRKRPGLPEGQWIDPMTAKEPRHEHVGITGMIKHIGEEFLPGVRFPGDPQAPASQVINCHCYWRRVRR